MPPHDTETSKQYISRHRANEDWNDPMSVGALSRFCWNILRYTLQSINMLRDSNKTKFNVF